MAKIEIYSTQFCPYCVRAKDLFTRKGVAFIELHIDTDENLKQQMLTRAPGQRTVPQIFINDTHIGGCDDLYALDRAGKLDPLLK